MAGTLVLVAAAFVLRAGIKGAGHSVLHTRLAISVSEGGVPPLGGFRTRSHQYHPYSPIQSGWTDSKGSGTAPIIRTIRLNCYTVNLDCYTIHTHAPQRFSERNRRDFFPVHSLTNEDGGVS